MYCDVEVLNFARHLKRQHSDEIEVSKFLQLNKLDPMRKQIINKIRKEGDFCSGEAIAVQRKGENSENNKETCKLLPCTHCKGQYFCLKILIK